MKNVFLVIMLVVLGFTSGFFTYYYWQVPGFSTQAKETIKIKEVVKVVTIPEEAHVKYLVIDSNLTPQERNQILSSINFMLNSTGNNKTWADVKILPDTVNGFMIQIDLDKFGISSQSWDELIKDSRQQPPYVSFFILKFKSNLGSIKANIKK